ncbi:glycoside hydrolase domain-containing protein [Echinicola jeungdonensis]|uniref:Glycoside hydrolase domain-containing protein n=1 Tax=Echinicola jeungdonensis TaxID=709343 RepID=A0ABV5J0S1_9BACT
MKATIGGVIHEIRKIQIPNMGQYAHRNQPIQHMIYLYNYAGPPWKAQYWIRETMVMVNVEMKIMDRHRLDMSFQQWVFIQFVQALINMFWELHFSKR